MHQSTLLEQNLPDADRLVARLDDDVEAQQPVDHLRPDETVMVVCAVVDSVRRQIWKLRSDDGAKHLGAPQGLCAERRNDLLTGAEIKIDLTNIECIL